jgi:hypothetical protein
MSWRQRGAGFVLSMMVGQGSEGEVRDNEVRVEKQKEDVGYGWVYSKWVGVGWKTVYER